MNTLGYMGSAKADPEITKAIREAMVAIERKVSTELGRKAKQGDVAERLGLSGKAQGKISAYKSGSVTPRIEMLVRMRNTLGVTLDEMLRLDQRRKPSREAPLAEVIAFWPGRWAGLPIDFDQAAREGVPPEGWEQALDTIGHTFAPDRFPAPPSEDGGPRSRRGGAARGRAKANRRPRG